VRSLHEELTKAGLSVETLVAGPVSDMHPGVVVPVDADAWLPRRLGAFARAVPADTNLVDVHFALYGLLQAVDRRRPHGSMVVHFHGPWAEESRSGGTNARPRVWAKRIIERTVYRRADELVTLSSAFKRVLVERYGVMPWRVCVIPPGVDLERFSPGDRSVARRRLGLPADRWIIAAVRRLVPRMGLDVLLEAWAANPPPAGLLLLYGEGPERARLSRRVQALGLAQSVRLPGSIPDDDLPDLLRAADLTVVPSRALEGFGLAALESLACGTPVITSDAGGLPELVEGLDPPLIVPAADVAALTEKILEVHRGRAPAPEACRSHAERFTWPAAVECHVKTYGRVAECAEPSERVRVVYLAHTASLSGAEIALLRLVVALKEDVDAHVVLAEDGPLVDRLLRAGVSSEVFPMWEHARGTRRNAVGVAALLGGAGYAARLAWRLRRLRPDVVHANSLKSALYGTVASRLAGIPAVWYAHDLVTEDHLPRRAIGPIRSAARLLPAAVICNSAATAATLPGVPDVRVIPPPVPTTAACAADVGDFRVGMIGRVAPWKGQHVFVEAFARAFPTGTERAVVVGAPLFGADETTYFQRTRELGRALGLDDRLAFVGFRDRIDDELAGLDILVHASVAPEPFGQVIVEGMAAGVPVVAAAAGGPLEIIDDEIDGLLYPPGDVNRLALALGRLAAEPELRTRLGNAGKAKAARYAPEVVAPQVAAVYRGLLVRS
jgi:glycosyltransferase involved in cell wall biosynthesis